MTLQSLPLVDEPYRRQMTSFRRTRSAILDGTKSLISQVGFAKVNMIEIADSSEVSRATLYNHFRDKASVARALLESEVDRLLSIADNDVSPADILAAIAIEISTDSALGMMRLTDPGLLTRMLVKLDDPIWLRINNGLTKLMGDNHSARIARHWLIGQVMQPIEVPQIREQVRLIIR